jgi:DNA-binding transcriptional MerR regulator
MTMTNDDAITLSSIEVADRFDIPYRMLDYWLREGHVTLACDPHPGSGRRRTWTADEVAALQLFAAEYHKLQEMQEQFRTGRVWDRMIRIAEASSRE